MKKFLIFILIVAAIFIVAKLSVTSPDESIPEATNQEVSGELKTTQNAQPAASDLAQEENITPADIAVAFTGYGPGKSHDGTISVKESTLVRTGENFKGSVVFDMNSINSTPDRLVTDLKSSRFFDAAKYPTATFTVTESTGDQLKGNLTIKGVTQPVTLPIAYDVATSSFTSTVRVNMELFGIKQALADKDFVVKITVK